MRISDWSSDVCSSDLDDAAEHLRVDDGVVVHAEPAEQVVGIRAQLRGGAELRRLPVELHRGGDERELVTAGVGHGLDEAVLAGLRIVGELGDVLDDVPLARLLRSEEQTSELQSLMRISYA